MIRWSLIVVIFLALNLDAGAKKKLGDAKKGFKIAKKVADRNKGKTSITQASMSLFSRKGTARKRNFRTFEIQKGKESSSRLIRFSGPDKVKGLGLLTHNYPGQDSDQWVFLPDLNKSRRISSSGKGGRFVGSDFYYEDLEDRAVGKDTHYFIKKENLDGIKTNVVISVPKKKKSSVYRQRKLWIHPEIHIPLKVEFYKRGKKPIKTLTVKRIEEIDGIWTVMESEMVSHKDRHKTVIVYNDVAYNEKLKKVLFTKQTLGDPSRDQSM